MPTRDKGRGLFVRAVPALSPRSAIPALLLSIAVITATFAAAVLFSSHAEALIAPKDANRMIEITETPVLAPGESGTFSLNFSNPFNIGKNWTEGDMENKTMRDIYVNVTIYRYMTIHENKSAEEINSSPIIRESGGLEYKFLVSEALKPVHILKNATQPVEEGRVKIEFTIDTKKDTEAGGYFSKSSYFIRFWMTFKLGNKSYDLFSRGYISDEDWHYLKTTASSADSSGLNESYLEEMGCDGIIPESSIVVYKPIPAWPFYGLVVGCVFLAVLAVLFYVEEKHPGFPGLKKGFEQNLGKFYQFRSLLKHRFIKLGRKINIALFGEKR